MSLRLNERGNLMLTFLFPIVFTAGFVFLLVQAFRMMTFGLSSNGSHSESKRQDRTGLLTTHPELLDQNGDITSENLLVVKFFGLGDSDTAPA